MPLAFLWIRTILKKERNIAVVRGAVTDPYLPPHELTDSPAIFAHVRQSLVPHGRLIVVDRAPKREDHGANRFIEHEISAEQVEGELREAGLEIVTRQDDFIDKDPENETWWLIVARNP